nr:hypothetical protein [Tanacetum cinerariifolium]
MANVPPNDPNIRDNIHNNQNGWIEEDAEEEEKDPEEDPEEDPKEYLEDDDDVIEMDVEAEVIDHYIDDGSNNPPPPNSKDEETPPTSPVIPDANGQPIPPIASFGQNFHFDFIKCSPITFRGNEGAVGLIGWIEKTKMVFTVSKCTEANKVVFSAATFQDRALTWWNLQVATLGIEAVTRKTWAKIKVMMMTEFCPLEEIQRMECELWNLRVKEMDISSYATRFNELVILCPGMVPTERKKKEKLIIRRGSRRTSKEAVIVVVKIAIEVHVPLKKRTLVVKGDDCVSRLKVVSCMKVKKYVDDGSYLFVAQVVEKELAERHLEDVSVICKFPDVFHEDLPGLPPPRQVEFKIELVPEAAPVARAPYRLAPSEMK